MSGTLYIVATPIGNLEDVTLRALRILKEADLIACEDTRQTAKLLRRYGIRTPTISYHEHNERERARLLIHRLKEGAIVALVSDAGAPGLSDPGRVLIARAHAEGIPVVPVPGPSALTTALMVAGFAVERFLFVGFLPASRRHRRRELEALAHFPYPLIFFEAPHRLRQMLDDIREILGNRSVLLAREMTKAHEEFLCMTLQHLIDHLKWRRIRGEIVVLLAGAEPTTKETAVPSDSVIEQIRSLVARYRLDAKTAARIVADLHQKRANQLYREYLKTASASPSRRELVERGEPVKPSESLHGFVLRD